MYKLDRRHFLIGSGAFAGLLTSPVVAAPKIRDEAKLSDTPFTLGVASGDPSEDGFVIWTRLAPKPLDEHGGMTMRPTGVPVRWEVAGDEGFQTLLQRGETIAYAELGYSVHVELRGLLPNRPYWYRFTYQGFQSRIGRGKTAPVAGSALDRVRFAAVGCQRYDDGYYTAYRHLSGEELDFVFHYGDYIYETPFTPNKARQVIGDEPFSLDDYRRRYALYKLDPDLQAAHANFSWFVTLDDHEVQNNWAGEWDQYQTPPEVFLLRRQAAFQAYYENMPLRRSSMPRGPDMQIYRRAVYGDLLNANFMDTRQYRTDQPCGDDFKPYCPEAFDPKGQMINKDEEAWLYHSLNTAGTRWNLLAQQVMMMPMDRRNGQKVVGDQPVINMDAWAGYPVARQRLVDHFKGLGNVIVVTGDEHQNFVGELRANGLEGESLAVEFVGTSISAGGNGHDVRKGNDVLQSHNPHLAFTNDQRGYILCDVGRDTWRTDLRVVDFVEQPDAPIRTRASFAVERGNPKLQKA